MTFSIYNKLDIVVIIQKVYYIFLNLIKTRFYKLLHENICLQFEYYNIVYIKHFTYNKCAFSRYRRGNAKRGNKITTNCFHYEEMKIVYTGSISFNIRRCYAKNVK